MEGLLNMTMREGSFVLSKSRELFSVDGHVDSYSDL